MNVLGIHIGHDSGAALISDGQIAADAAEERFTRIKHDCGLPIHAIDYCLRSQGMTMEDIDAITIPTSGSVPDLNFLFNLRGPKWSPRRVDGARSTLPAASWTSHR